ncbi:MAG: tetratricopeptide repeat protein [Burkholderiales bacterium]
MAACGAPAQQPINFAEETARARNLAANRLLESGNLDGALAQYRLALEAARSVENFELMGSILLNLSLAHAKSFQWVEAHGAVDTLIASPANFAPALAGQARARKALLHLDQGNLPAALNLANDAERGCATPCPFAAALANLRAFVAIEQGRYEEAAALGMRARELANKTESEQATASRLQGRALSLMGRHADALTALTQALQLDKTLGASASITLDLIYLGDAESRRQGFAAARDYYERALAVSMASGDTQGAALARARANAVPK